MNISISSKESLLSSSPLLRLPLPTLQKLIRREKAERRLLDFVKLLWPVLEPDRDFVPGWHLEAIAEHLEAVTYGEITHLLINVPPGSMKACCSNTPVLTTWGWKRHGDLQPGDFVYGPDGHPKRVIACTPEVVEEAYEVRFDDGASIVTGAGHLWSVEREERLGPRRRETRIVSTPDLRWQPRGSGRYGPDRIPVCAPIQMAPKRLLIEPYLLGVWLGDGATRSGCIYAAEQDYHAFASLGRLAHTMPAGGSRQQAFHRIAVDDLQVSLRVMGLLGNKHIPDDYLEGSVEQRLALLQGLMDTDGHCAVDGECHFTNKLEALALGVERLVCSLGMKAYVRSRYTVLDGTRYGPHYQVTFRAPATLPVFRLERKQERAKEPAARTRCRYVEAVIPVGPRSVKCIQVEGSNYLVGHRLVPTHNSLLVDCFWPLWEWGPCNLPSLRYFCGSYQQGITIRDNQRFLNCINSPQFQELWGDRFALTHDSATKIINDRTGWKLATSVGGIGTGERGDRVIVDDPHNVVDAESEVERKNVLLWFNESLPLRVNDPKRSAFIVIMQRVHEEDVSGHILAQQLGYTHLMIPMEHDRQRHCVTSIGWEDPRTEEGELYWPQHMSPAYVERIKFQLGRFGAASQLQQSPMPKGGNIFNADHWKVWPPHGVDEELKTRFPDLDYVLVSVDTAMSEKEEADESAITVWAVWRDWVQNSVPAVLREANDIAAMSGEPPPVALPRLMLKFSWSAHASFRELVDKIEELCRKHQADTLLIEAKANGLSVGQEIVRLNTEQRWATYLQPARGDKVARAHSVAHFLEQGMIWAPDRAWATKVIDQMAVFPHGKRDDLVDSTTQAWRYLRDSGMLALSGEAQLDAARTWLAYATPSSLVPPNYDL